MKYIRTKDKIYKVDEKEMIACPNDDGTTDVYYKLESGKLINRDDVIKEADRLEYLMDCYAVNEDITVDLQLAKSWQKHAREEGNYYDLFGAVWTYKGRFYIAKMTKEWELL